MAQRRKGSVDDPFVAIEENLTIIQNHTVLTEVPNRFEKVDVYASEQYSPTVLYHVGDFVYLMEGAKQTFECVQDSIGNSPADAAYWQRVCFVEVMNINKSLDRFEYCVDYLNGMVSHHDCFNNRTLTYKYLGEGIHLFPASRIYSETAGTNTMQTLQNIIQTSATRIGIHDREPLPEEGIEGEIWLVI